MASASMIASANATRDFADLVREHQTMVFSLAYHFLHDRAAAEEISQDVFLQLYFHVEEMNSPEHVIFWLRKVTANRCIDEGRRRQRRGEVPIEFAGDPAFVSGESDAWVSHRLRRLVASLPGRPRMIVILRYQEDLEPMEIAELLNISVNTVKSQLQRALALLREKSGAVKRA